MENQRYMQAGIDLKRMFLLLKDKVWMVVAAVVAGALLGGGVYLLVHFVFAPQPEYQSVSKLYLNFNCDPEDFTELSYNGYTWNDLMVTDPILDYTMEALASDVDRDTVIAATKAEILSDIRLLTITITTDDPQLNAQIMEATKKALVHLGETDELFESIEVYSTTEPELIVLDNRVGRAAVTGAVLALVLVLLMLAFYYVLDDSVYVEKDGERLYGIPVLGIFTADKPGNFQKYGTELLTNYLYMTRDMKKVSLVSADAKEDAQEAGRMIEKLLSARDWEAEDEAQQKDTKLKLQVCGMPEEEMESFRRMRETDGVILTVRFGSGNGKRVERVLSNLEKQDCSVSGIIIVGADEQFLKLYYMGKKGKAGKEKASRK